MAIINGTPGNDVLVGTPEDDVINGLDGNDVISGLEGNDQLDGGAGNDSIAGNQGNDSIFGGAGDDTLYGGQGNDLVIGEAGNDIIGGDAGTNTLTGGVGRDRFILTTAGTAIITDFFAGDDSLGLSGDLTIDDIEVSQSFANTLVLDRRTGNVLATLNNVNSADLRRQNFVDAAGRIVNFAPVPATLVDVTATDPIARATNPDDPIVFTVSRTNTTGDLVVNFTLSTSAGVALQNPPTSVRIPNGQAFANVTVTPQATSRDGTVTITLQDSPNYDVRTGIATGTVSAPVSLPTPAPQPAPPEAPPFVDLILTRSDIPTRPAQGEQAVALFTVGNRGTGRADRVVFDLTMPVDSDVVRVEPSQGVFTGFTGDSARTGIIKVELGNIDPNREATIRVTYVPKTTGNFLSSNARVTAAQPDVDPSNNFANANVTVVPSPPNLPVVSVVAAEDGVAREPDSTQLEGTDRETPTGLVTRDFIFRRTGGDLSRPLTVNYTLEGTAQNGVDFAPIGSSVTFAPFETEVRVTIRPIQDRQVEGAEFVRLNLVPNPLVFRVDATRGENTARIEIVDVPNPVGPNPLPGTVVSLVAIDQFTDELVPGTASPTRGVLRVTRDNTIGDLVVKVEVTGTATHGVDYILFDTLNRAVPVVNGVAFVTIPDGQRFIDVYLEAIDDPLQEGDERAVFNLAPDPNAIYVIGRPQDVASDSAAIITIRDDEPPLPTPVLRLIPSQPTAIEGGQNAVLTLTRTGSTADPLNVSLTTVTAEFRIQPLVIEGGQTVPSQEQFNTQIRPVLPLPPFLTVPAGQQFIDIDLGTVKVRTPLVDRVDETTVTVQLRVGRTGDTSTPLTLPRSIIDVIGTLGGNATLGLDYELPPSVVIPAGANTIDVPIPALLDNLVEGTERFAVLAGTESGLLVLGQPAVFSIQDANIPDPEEAVILSNEQAIAVEGATPGTLRVRRTGSTDRAVTVPLVAISYAETRESRLVGLPAEAGPPAFPAESVLLTAPPIALPLFVTFPAGQRVITIDATTKVSGAALSGRVAEADLQSKLSISRSGDISRPLTIPGTVVETLRATGFPGVTLTVDVDIPSSAVIPAGQSFVDVPVVATTDNVFEGPESLAVIINPDTLPDLAPGYRPAGSPQIFYITDAGLNLIVGTISADILIGTSGSDVLLGGLGNDNLTGGPGADQFVFTLPAEGVDTITDFDPDFDSIRISQTGFGAGLTPGTLPAAKFVSGPGVTTPSSPDHRFIYDTTTGNLRFDPDGSTPGGQPPVLLATLTGAPALTTANIVIF
ncbi:MAG: Calx-beta domain-containing protein [Pseudanabaenaceae cyanobacterium]